MANTYTLIASSTVGSGGAATIDFSSIPSTYTDLKLVLSARNGDTGGGAANIKLNNDGTAANYSYNRIIGNGSTASSDNATTFPFIYVDSSDYTASTFGNGELYIPNYTSSNKKSMFIDSVIENNATSSREHLEAALWTGTAAINQITLTSSSGNFVQYSTAYLYGIKNS